MVSAVIQSFGGGGARWVQISDGEYIAIRASDLDVEAVSKDGLMRNLPEIVVGFPCGKPSPGGLDGDAGDGEARVSNEYRQMEP